MQAVIQLNGSDSTITLLDNAISPEGVGDPASANVAAQYLAIIADLADDGNRAATFADAERIHSFIEQITEFPQW
ncbi:hypothetical protein [Rhodococcus sp. 27YEA15]|uniref:hypothetical protein n=1 Tax=Rhodococcus sp. 27YEA15 TaxID=3156259 RepID=UPI003C7B6FEE